MINIINDCQHPAFNLALEEYALKHLLLDEKLLIIWQNKPAVVIGRNQNTIEEINESYVRDKNIEVVRRLSGGGAVYHDLGNLNFTFIVPNQKNLVTNFREFTKPVLETLNNLGVPAQFSGRNDLTIEGKKFSGNAQYWSKDRLLHHGTILFDSDLSVVQEVLNVKIDKLRSKGIKSVRSRVTNIYPYLSKPMKTEEFKEILLEHILADQKHRNYELSKEELEGVQALTENRYSKWEWNYGSSPPFDLEKSQRFAGGNLNLKFNVKNGLITKMKIFGDFFGKEDVHKLALSLQGQVYREDFLREFLKSINFADFFSNISPEEFITCLFK